VSIPNLLTPEELEQLYQGLAKAEFVDGQLTAGWHAKLVKHNRQATKTEATAILQQVIHQALGRHPLFQAVVRPKLIHSILFSRYGVDMVYGRHIDNVYMGGASLLCSDVSWTVFLSEPDT
ncbi:MAG: PKHD-type hydroxylase, partial [Leptolyngbyaceae cyanobacterium SM2_3_12]|nr:PKHD-type hydroxylase [Leptolyngbyaceae cyanobacterium SM2_3_12]